MSFRYTLEESLAGFRRNRAATLITIFTVSISLLLLGVFAIITLNFSEIVEEIRTRVEVEAFLREELSEAQHRETGKRLRSIRGVEEVTYISKDEAARIFQREFGEKHDDLLEDNPLPASYRLKIHQGYDNPDSIAVIARKAESTPGVESVVYRKQFLNLIETRARTFRYATLFIGIVLGLSAIILVANTIRLTIEAKRGIIRTMKLVGATAMFIRLPFLIEGILHGIIGGILAAILLGVSIGFFIEPLSEDLLLSFEIKTAYYLVLIAVGGLLGFIGSMVSIGRFLRETLSAQT
ncbi:MAG: permease-like cell division protein FtsX [Bacteroidota bacterium]|nr:permease-like cell division protein FtsX [Bacteroidota bacterium]